MAKAKCKVKSIEGRQNDRCQGYRYANRKESIKKKINNALESGKCEWADDLGAGFKSGPRIKASCSGSNKIVIKEYDSKFDRDCKGKPKNQMTISNNGCMALWLAIVPNIQYYNLQIVGTGSSSSSSPKNTWDNNKASYKTVYYQRYYDGGSTAGGVLAAWIIGIICCVCMCVACCWYLIKRDQNSSNVVVIQAAPSIRRASAPAKPSAEMTTPAPAPAPQINVQVQQQQPMGYGQPPMMPMDPNMTGQPMMAQPMMQGQPMMAGQQPMMAGQQPMMQGQPPPQQNYMQ